MPKSHYCFKPEVRSDFPYFSNSYFNSLKVVRKRYVLPWHRRSCMPCSLSDQRSDCFSPHTPPPPRPDLIPDNFLPAYNVSNLQQIAETFLKDSDTQKSHFLFWGEGRREILPSPRSRTYLSVVRKKRKTQKQVRTQQKRVPLSSHLKEIMNQCITIVGNTKPHTLAIL